MINKQIGSILLISGICIGSGMIALPMTLIKIGLIPSLLLMITTWLMVYYSSLISAELQLNCNDNLPLGELGRRFSGPIAGFVGDFCTCGLHYSLLAAYIYGGSSVLHKLVGQLNNTAEGAEVAQFAVWCAGFLAVVLMLPIKIIDYVNRVLFLILIAIVASLLGALIWGTELNFSLPDTISSFPVWTAIIPILFTSFGFQGSIHSIASYCGKDASMLKKAIFWGTLIPMIVYFIWTIGTLSAVRIGNPILYMQMIHGNADIGEFISCLTSLSGRSKIVEYVVWWISLLAIATSAIGVGIGLLDSIKSYLNNIMSKRFAQGFTLSTIAVVVVIVPPLILAAAVPNAFISFLGFAGMTLAILAIFLPLYLYSKHNKMLRHYPVIEKRYVRTLIGVCGCVIVAAELFNILL